jgi:hypothetical protein
MSRLRSLAALPVLVLGLAACTAAATGARADAPRVSEGDSFTMLPGTAVSVSGDGTLRYLRVVNDSRCKPDVQCVWAGDAEVAFEWTPSAGAADAFNLHTGKGDKSHAIGRHVLVLAGLGREPAFEAQLKLEAPAP